MQDAADFIEVESSDGSCRNHNVRSEDKAAFDFAKCATDRSEKFREAERVFEGRAQIPET